MTGPTPPGDHPPSALHRGDVAWADLPPSRGREQDGRRPVLVVASHGYLETVTHLVVILPVTTVDRGWPNHVRLRGRPGMDRPSWAMTEQVRTVARDRLAAPIGLVDDATLAEVDTYLRDALGL